MNSDKSGILCIICYQKKDGEIGLFHLLFKNFNLLQIISYIYYFTHVKWDVLLPTSEDKNFTIMKKQAVKYNVTIFLKKINFKCYTIWHWEDINATNIIRQNQFLDVLQMMTKCCRNVRPVCQILISSEGTKVQI